MSIVALPIAACDPACTLDSKKAAVVRVELSPGDDVTGLATVYWRHAGELEWQECRAGDLTPPAQAWGCASEEVGEIELRAEYQELGEPLFAEDVIFAERRGACDDVQTQEVTLVLDP